MPYNASEFNQVKKILYLYEKNRWDQWLVWVRACLDEGLSKQTL